jgi:hypothetical protein
MGRRALGSKPRNGRIEPQKWIYALNGKVGAKGQMFRWRGPTGQETSPQSAGPLPRYDGVTATGGVSDKHMRF